MNTLLLLFSKSATILRESHKPYFHCVVYLVMRLFSKLNKCLAGSFKHGQLKDFEKWLESGKSYPVLMLSLFPLFSCYLSLHILG